MGTIKWILTIFFLLSIIGVVSALNTPYSLSGHVYNTIDNNPVIGASVTFTNLNSSEVIYAVSTTNGEYQQDAANFPSGYSNGDIIQYYVSYNSATTTSNATIDTSYGGIIKDIYITVPQNEIITPVDWTNTFINPSWALLPILVIVFVTTLIIGAIIGRNIVMFDLVNATFTIIVMGITLYVGIMIMNNIQ